MKKLCKIFLCCLCLSMLMGSSVSAEETIPTVTVAPINVATALPEDATSGGITNNQDPLIKPDESKVYDKFGIETDILPKVTIEESSSFIEKKSVEVVNVARTLGVYAVVIALVFALCKMVFGVSTIGAGLLGMLACGVAYICIRYAPMILQAFETWVFTTPL